MKRLAFVVVCFAAVLATAQGPFDGTWKTKADSIQAPPKTDQYKVGDGRYACLTCAPKVDVKADGTDQKVTGNPYVDSENVKVTGDRSIETTEKKDGKVVGTGKLTVSPDNQTMTVKWTFANTNGKAGEGTSVLKRVGAAPASGNMVTGEWRFDSLPAATDNTMMFTFKSSPDGITYEAATGENYTAKVDGKDYPYKGDPGTTSVSLKKINDRTLEETDKRDGKVINVSRITVSADGKTLAVVSDDKLHHQVWKATAEKQETASGK